MDPNSPNNNVTIPSIIEYVSIILENDEGKLWVSRRNNPDKIMYGNFYLFFFLLFFLLFFYIIFYIHFFNVNQLLIFVVHHDITFNLVMLFNTFLICLLVTFFSDFF